MGLDLTMNIIDNSLSTIMVGMYVGFIVGIVLYFISLYK